MATPGVPARTAGRVPCCALVAAMLLCGPALADDDSLKIRIAWGGGSERQWQGSVALSEGTLGPPQPLGIEADEPGSMWLAEEAGVARIAIAQRSPRSYDALDLTITAPLTAKLTVQLTAADDPDRPATLETTLAKLVGETQNKELDNRGNRLLVHRAPGDALRIAFDRPSLVFAPGETFRFTVEPQLLPLAAGTKARLRVQMTAGRGQRELWSHQQSFVAGQTGPLAVETPLKEPEGVYELAIAVAPQHGWPHAVRQTLAWNKPVAERTVQLVILGAKSPAATRREPELSAVVQIDPANPRWWDFMAKMPQLPKAPRLWKGPLGNGKLDIWKHTLGDVARLAPNADAGEVSWEAYTLPIGQPGRPHVLEVDYPSDVPQTLGLSVVEPDASGAVMPIGLDSGIDVGEEVVARPARWLKHRLIFWPRTSNPMLLVSNRRERSPGVYGKIRVLAGWEHLPAAAAWPAGTNPRRAMAYFDRPLFPENFSAPRALDTFSGHCLDDWQTFYEGGRRLVEYLNHVGYNGLMLSAAAEGSALYPSEVLWPTPRFDKGALFGTGQDAVRKDVLEVVFRLCDREQIQLIPAVEFSAPLPELEAAIRRGGPEAEAMQWIGADGNTFQQAWPPRRGLSPYYNTLHPQVQAAMLAVVRELATRYGHHPSFGGVAVQLSAQGYAQLPGPEWGLDDATIARFEQQTRQRVPGEGETRFARRAEFLAGPGRAAWQQWRAETLQRFYRQMHDEIAAVRKDARLHLAGANLLAGEPWEGSWRPSLPRRALLADALLRAGIDPQHYQSDRGPLLLRPERIAPTGAAHAWAVNQELTLQGDFDRVFHGQTSPGSLFFHQPQETRIESFDQKSPFRPTFTWLVAQPTPSDRQNRRRFVHSLATIDAQVMVDGGWLLPMGQEDAVRGLLVAYRRLPAVRFERLNETAGGSQPVTFRTASCAGRTYLYAVNDSPLRVTGRVRVEEAAACRIELLSGLRQIYALRHEADGMYWSVDLEPYDLVAVQFSQPNLRIAQPQIALPGNAEAAIAQRIRELGGRAAALRTPPPLKALGNPGFEQPGTSEDALPGWALTRRTGIVIQPDRAAPHTGGQAVQIASTGPVACLVSKPFNAPATGRLSMSVWLRIADAARQPPLRLAFEGRLNGQPYYRYAELGATGSGGQAGVALTAQWAQYVFPVEDLPLEGLAQLRVRFDLMGAGEVWADDVQLFDLAFSEKEHRELAKMITAAEHQLQSKQVGDCIRLLDGYWPRFLERNVAIEPPVVAAKASPTASAHEGDGTKPAPAPRGGIMDKMKDILPEKLRF